MNTSELERLPEEVETWPAARLVRWAVRRFGDGLALTCSFGGGGLVLAHMLHRIAPKVPVFFLDTGFHFPETLRFKEQFTEKYGLRVVDIRPRLDPEAQAARFGPALYARDPNLCCTMRKVEPLAAALLDGRVTGWMAALRRDQSPTRRHIRKLEAHVVADPPVAETKQGAATPPTRSRTVVKIHPLADWTRADVAAYVRRHRLPTHPLAERGYVSIGCRPCTRPVSTAEDERAGRWAGTDKRECGLHTFTTNRD